MGTPTQLQEWRGRASAAGARGSSTIVAMRNNRMSSRLPAQAPSFSMSAAGDSHSRDCRPPTARRRHYEDESCGNGGFGGGSSQHRRPDTELIGEWTDPSFDPQRTQPIMRVCWRFRRPVGPPIGQPSCICRRTQTSRPRSSSEPGHRPSGTRRPRQPNRRSFISPARLHFRYPENVEAAVQLRGDGPVL